MFQTNSCEFLCECLCDEPCRCFMLMLAGGGNELGRLPVRSCCHGLSASLSVLITCLTASCRELFTTFSDGCLGSINDEGRSEVR